MIRVRKKLKSRSKQIVQLWEEQRVSITTSGGGSSSNPSEPNRPQVQQPAQVAFSIPTSAMPPPNLTLPPEHGRSRIRTDSSPLLTLSKSMHNNKDSDNNGNHGNNTSRHKNVLSTNPFLPAPAFSQPAPTGITPPPPPSPSRGYVASKAEIDVKWSLWFARHHRNMLLLSKGETLSSVHSDIDTLDCLYD